MKAVKVSQFGAPDVLKLQDSTEIPVPGSNQVQSHAYNLLSLDNETNLQVLIELKAAGVNPVDTYIRSGTYASKPKLPYIPGKDGAGVVAKVGREVSDFQVGQRVFCMTQKMGTYAEFVLADAHEVFSLPDSVSFSQGASVGIPYFTAYRALVLKAQVRSGDTVLIHGASGAVGIAAIQLAKHLGCVVFGTAGSEEGMQLVLSQGAKHVFNHRGDQHMADIMKATGSGGVNVIIEMLADANLHSDLECIAKNGRIVASFIFSTVVGCRGEANVNPRLLMAKEASVVGVMLGASTEEETIETGRILVDGLREGWLVPVVDKEYRIENVAEAHEEVLEHKSGALGKIVLVIGVLLDFFGAHGSCRI
ncbi:unnamed protein product [Notodromas monacha]|uniref:Enoyl reductase (ER) domain-containing protein n=1 Tax=Notodromas monacha TaxID=399045 RepID=A0A7R9G8J7_9CRUS|nr:unnamed protein product [Notodromas monacha]CAG0913353.1 unnamed protein product [Notodromas monacha]